MGLDIGGAETHVLELSRALSACGEEVTVASNGGVYVAELEKSGIRHVKLPLHTKNPISVLHSYIGLFRLIKREKFDIVHAHARIPAFICGLLQKRLHFRLVCSAHWVFEVNAVWRRIACWGDRTIAVSEDIKQYVIDNYGVFSDNVSTTINGVDMKKFSKDTDCSELEAELSLPRERQTVVYVSRMDSDRSLAARQLCAVAARLKARFPLLQIVIAGDGDDFAEVKALADKANGTAGENFVRLIGARTDINRVIALGDVFVGVSRAALEAMSASKPVIIAGNEGYIGLLDENNLSIASATNFCCRGCPETTDERLFRDISVLLSLDRRELEAIGESNRSIIERDYSATRMARDCLEVYRSLAPYDSRKYSDILFSGYYGFGNMGDDSLLLSIISCLKKVYPDVRITAFTRKPKEMRAKYGVKCVNRFNPFELSREMRHASLLISGGGSLFQNNTSAKSLAYYINIIRMAKRHGLKVMVYANGIGPLYGERSRRAVKNVLGTVDAISLREPSSLELLRQIGVPETMGITVSADPALTLKPASPERTAYILEKNGISDVGNCFAVSLREWQSLRTSDGGRDSDAFSLEMATAVAEISRRFGKTPVFIPVQRASDREMCLEVMRRSEELGGAKAFILEGLSASEVIALLGKMSFALGMRLHMLIYATAAGVPAVGISYDPKVKAFLEYAGQVACFDANGVTASELIGASEKLLCERGEICARVSARAKELAALAEKDARQALELAGKC